MNNSRNESAIEWIGSIPNTWSLTKIGNEFSLRNTKVSDRDYQPLSVTKLSEGVVPQIETVAKSDAHDDRKLVLKGDFVINSRSDRRMSCGVSNYDGSVSLINLVLSPRKKLSSRFTNYLFKNACFADEFYKWGHGIVADLWTTRWDDMKNIPIAIPNYDTQEKIASYITKKEIQIDKLVANQEEQLIMLQEYRQSVITKAVTLGIDTNVDTKDSGIAWIGDIPSSWSTIKIKFTSWLKGRIGWDGLKSSEFIDDGPFLITGTDFEEGNINWNTCVHISNERFNQDKDLHIFENDLLITKDGTIGKLAIVKNCPDKVSLNSGVMIIRNNSNFKYASKYLYYVLSSDQFLLWYQLSQSGNSTIKHLYQGQFYDFEYTFPSINEQERIISFLDKQTAKIDRLIAIKKAKIDRMLEYKKTLIYDCITGKKEIN